MGHTCTLKKIIHCSSEIQNELGILDFNFLNLGILMYFPFFPEF